MSRCLARERERARACADGLDTHESVVAVDVLAPEAGPVDRWPLEIVLRPRADGVPHRILDYLGSYQLSLRRVCQRGDHSHAVAVC